MSEPISTKERILDAAEKLFGMNGFEATSLRDITAEAGVNLAAVNYHFHSKDSLIDATIERRIEPVNRKRLELLEALGPGPTLEGILAARLRVMQAGERDLLEKAAASGKPAEIVEKMVTGSTRKYYEEVVLTEQPYIMDDKSKVSQAIEKAAKEIGAPVKLAGFLRFGLGEGIQKAESDFAAEVAGMAKG